MIGAPRSRRPHRPPGVGQVELVDHERSIDDLDTDANVVAGR
jgi:hypothetical protein